jgi:hypothetical protein
MRPCFWTFPLEWTLDPVHFRSGFQQGEFNAYTDGALRSTVDEGILSIVEVKRELRDKNLEGTDARRCGDGELDIE